MISPLINSDFTIAWLHHFTIVPFSHHTISPFRHFTMRIEIYCWIFCDHFTITHSSCFLKQVVLMLAEVRTNPLWQQPLKNKGLQIQGKRIEHSRRGCQAKEKRFPPVEGVLAAHHHFTISPFIILLFHHFTIYPCVVSSHQHFNIST